MQTAEFSLFAIAADGAVLRLMEGGGAEEIECPPSYRDELEDVVRLASRGRHCALLPSQWCDLLPGQGEAFFVNSTSLRDPWRASIAKLGRHTTILGIVVRFDQEFWTEGLASIAAAYGLTELETRIAGMLLSRRDPSAEGAIDGLGSAAVRNASNRLRRKLGTVNMPATVGHLMILLVALPEGSPEQGPEWIGDALGLTRRQATFAREFASGASRKEIAKQNDCSLALVKAELSKVYELLEVSSAVELTAVVTQVAHVADTFLVGNGGGPSRPRVREEILTLPDGREVGYSIFGPSAGDAAVILHSNITCRYPPSRLVARLVEGGRRVLAVDRPGFGDTSSGPQEIEGHSAQLCADLAAVCKAEGIATFILLARSAPQIAVVIENSLPAMVRRVIVSSPTPPASVSQQDRGPLGAVKRRFTTHPGSIRLMIGLLLRFATPMRIRNGMRRAFAQSPPDLAALDDPLVSEDYLKAAQGLRQNLDGYVVENLAWATDWTPPCKSRGKDWVLVFGDSFVLHDPASARAHFAAYLPLANSMVARNAGQMLMYSHPDVLVGLIDGADSVEPRS